MNFTNLRTWGGRAELGKAVSEKHLLTYGGEYFNDDSFNTDQNTTITTLRAPFPIDFICGPSGAIPFPFECVFEDFDDVPNTPNAENTGSGIFIQDTFWVTNRLTAIFGARWGRSETKAKPTPGTSQEIINLADFSDDKLVGALNLTYAATDTFHLVGSIATAFRAPNIIERLFNGPTPEGFGYQILNPDLQSEESLNFDVGIKYQDRRAFFEATYFENEIDNAIVQHVLTEQEFMALPPELQEDIINSGFEGLVIQQRNAETLTIKGVEAA
ncbi:MAG: TonB-dependent receptor, partial [Acidobacteriota bacterium]